MASIKIEQLNKKKKDSNGKWSETVKQLMSKDISLGSSKLNDKKKTNFYNDLYILLSSGIDLRSTLDLMCEEVTQKEEKKVYEAIRKSVLEGNSLSDAIEKTNQFSIYECYSIRIGEETGCLNDILKDLVSFFTKRIEQKRKMKSAFSYPIFVLSIAIIAVVFMMIVVVPMFQDVFARFGNDLPYLTQLIINISNGIIDHFTIILLVIALLVFLYLMIRRSKNFNKIRSSIILRLPFFGELTRKMYLARFSLAMALLTSAHIPVLQSLGLIKKMIQFYPIQSSLETIEEEIMKGKPFHESLSKFKIYDRRMVSLIKVGEEVNQLDIVFNRLKNQYMEEVDYQTSMASGILEPLMIVFVGIFVGIILISMYLPIFELSTSIGY